MKTHMYLLAGAVCEKILVAVTLEWFDIDGSDALP
jgi:hypothetical protein